MSLTIHRISQIVKGKFLAKTSEDLPVDFLLFDSRQLKFPHRSLFFAFKGVRQDGHDFIPSLYSAGVRSFMVSKKISTDLLSEANIIWVEDVVHALQDIVIEHRANFDLPVIGITGSNGKTIIKEWLTQLLSPKLNIIKTPKSYNSQIGVPFSVWQLNTDCDLSIFEAGISQSGEMQRLEPIIRPTIGIFTNIGSAHAEGFSSLSEKINEKALLFRRCRQVIVCRDHLDIYQVAQAQKASLFTWSATGLEADLSLKIQPAEHGTLLQYQHESHLGELRIPFADAASIQNACHCIATLIVLGEDPKAHADGFGRLASIEMRLEAREGINRCIIINDAYSADLESLSIALSFAKHQTNLQRKTIILTDFLQQAQTDDVLYSRIATLLEDHGFDRVFGIGQHIHKLKRFLSVQISQTYYTSVARFAHALPKVEFGEELILIKGARSFGLEFVADMLSRQRHATVLEINLAALARNLKVFESHLEPGVKIMAMVKAAAYGSGSVEIARFLASRNVDYLAVAFVDEGMELRRAGIKVPIMVLNSDSVHTSIMVENDLEPEVFTLSQLESITLESAKLSKKVKIHLKLETGMHRLGLDYELLDQIVFLLSNAPHVQVESIFSHLAASESKEQDDFTLSQISLFERFSTALLQALAISPLRHILNSNGTILHPQAQYDMVRLGIGMYGIGMPNEVDLERVHTLRSSISQVKQVTEGDTIGYGRAGKVARDMIIATVGIGYADGLIRKAGNGRYAVVLNGCKAPIVGNICMDMMMIDVTGIPSVEVGSPVTIFGDVPTVETLARAAETIPYEVFTSLSERIRRIYIYD